MKYIPISEYLTIQHPGGLPEVELQPVRAFPVRLASPNRAQEHICLNTMPLFHIHGLIVNILASAVAGSQVVCLPGIFQAPGARASAF